jgi:hypothetical protein
VSATRTSIARAATSGVRGGHRGHFHPSVGKLDLAGVVGVIETTTYPWFTNCSTSTVLLSRLPPSPGEQSTTGVTMQVQREPDQHLGRLTRRHHEQMTVAMELNRTEHRNSEHLQMLSDPTAQSHKPSHFAPPSGLWSAPRTTALTALPARVCHLSAREYGAWKGRSERGERKWLQSRAAARGPAGRRH